MLTDEQFKEMMQALGKSLNDHDLLIEIRSDLKNQAQIQRLNRDQDMKDMALAEAATQKAHKRIDVMEKDISAISKKQDRTHWIIIGAAGVFGAMWKALTWIGSFWSIKGHP